jgi:NADH-quinone oxidoreductase subunit C
VEKLKIEREHLKEKLAEMKKSGFDYLEKITAVDYSDHLDVIYMLENIEESKEEIVEVTIPANDAWVPSVMKLFLAADWYERELSEMFGVNIIGRSAERLLLEKWDGKSPPLRKSFQWGMPYEEGAK